MAKRIGESAPRFALRSHTVSASRAIEDHLIDFGQHLRQNAFITDSKNRSILSGGGSNAEKAGKYLDAVEGKVNSAELDSSLLKTFVEILIEVGEDKVAKDIAATYVASAEKGDPEYEFFSVVTKKGKAAGEGASGVRDDGSKTKPEGGPTPGGNGHVADDSSSGQEAIDAENGECPVFNMAPTIGELQNLTWQEGKEENKICVIPELAAEWQKVGTVGFGMKGYEVNNLHLTGDAAVNTCCKVFQKFLQNASPPKFQRATWRNVIKAMRDADFGDRATALEKALPLWYAQKKK